jgi:predicted membrane metal-binding protein
MAKTKKEKKQFRGQLDNEEVLYVFRKHPIVMRKGLIFFMVAILLGTIPSFIEPEYSVLYGGLAIGFFVGLVLILPSWIYWYFTVYIMTNQRFIQQVQKGFFKKSYSDISLKHVQSLNYEVYGMQETLLGYGSLMIQTYLGDIVINDVHHPDKIVDALFEILREYGSVVEDVEQEAEISSRNNH